MDAGRCRRYFFLGFLITITILPISIINAKPSCNFPAIFNFGDSNCDTGGWGAGFGQPPSPNGETYFHTPSGRFSDGRILIDFIAESLGLPYLHAYLDSVGSNFSHGANFATSGSTIRPQNTTYRQTGYSPFSLDVQIVQFSDFHKRSQTFRKRGGLFEQSLPAEEYFSKALYTFDLGQNDLTAGYRLNMTTEQVKAYVPDVLQQFTNAIKQIYGEGGRSFWVHSAGPVGCLPDVVLRFNTTMAQADSIGCARLFNEIAQYFNGKLKEALVQLRRELPLAAITYVDVYTVKYTLVSQAKRYGFEHPLVVCCGPDHGAKYNYNINVKCGEKKIINGKEIITKSCENPTRRISWDGGHYTEAANKWIFEQISNGSFSDPPNPLEMSCYKD